MLGSTITLSVVAEGGSPLAYQWFKDGAALAGATAAQLALSDLEATSAGIYRVVVANDIGGTTSRNAEVLVIIPPAVTTQPVDLTVAPARFSPRI